MKIVINNKQYPVPKDLEQISLLDFIRDTVQLKGTKFGCGEGLCGACTVHLDGEAVRACQQSVGDVVGHRVLTIEGLADTRPEAKYHPVQEAWIEESVPQCGYCQPGQIMAASALLNHTPNPSDEEIRDEMSGNLCRCGTYPRIQRAIRRASKDRYYETR
ncbi:MAG: (2Fe-2S)-binding protein [Rhodospirillaceae bacterium]|jgi:isoquinoline 1-oxidoreductase subunit alpha|nr:(2Fe-2S)-binding protein [Rhodospirillaceae bacterium]MBT4940253.1 (2Fe-2S)-binding protein [Rhodospirillaceae bacterium]MBT7267893.1 (2Fe-2S)-binding protein [Rhodospirillaceae bacterium]